MEMDAEVNKTEAQTFRPLPAHPRIQPRAKGAAGRRAASRRLNLHITDRVMEAMIL